MTDTSYDMEMRVVIDTYVTVVTDTSYDMEMRVVWIDTYVTVVTDTSYDMEIRVAIDTYVSCDRHTS